MVETFGDTIQDGTGVRLWVCDERKRSRNGALTLTITELLPFRPPPSPPTTEHSGKVQAPDPNSSH